MAFWFRGTVVFLGMSHLPSIHGPSKGSFDDQRRGLSWSFWALTTSPLKFVQGIDFGGIVRMCRTLISLNVLEWLLKFVF